MTPIRPRVIVMRGIPGSGKTTAALDHVRAYHRDASLPHAYRLNRDDFRAMLWGNDGSGGGKRPTRAQERAALDARDAAFRMFLALGHVVILDDTNLRTDAELRETVRRAAIGPDGGGFNLLDQEVEIVDIEAHVDECIRRDLRRSRSVGEKVIREMEEKRRKVLGLDKPIEKVPGLPWAILCDIDGTLAHMTGRSPYDETRVGEDTLDETVTLLLGEARKGGDRIILMSGRTKGCEEATEQWLHEGYVPYDELHMRAVGDTRKDDIVKAELFDEHVLGRYNIRYVLDDRDQVVRMWRRRGLKCLQVAEGNF